MADSTACSRGVKSEGSGNIIGMIDGWIWEMKDPDVNFSQLCFHCVRRQQRGCCSADDS